MKPEQFYTEEQWKSELKHAIIDTLDDLDFQIARLSIIIQKAIPVMSTVQLRKVLANLQSLTRITNKVLED